MKYVYLILLMIIFIGFYLYFPREPLGKNEVSHAIVLETFRKIRKKYDIDISGVGGAESDGKIKEIIVYFRIYKPLSIDQGRTIFVDLMDTLLTTANSNENYKKYFLKTPFSIESVHVAIFIFGEHGEEIFEPNIYAISSKGKNIVYEANILGMPNKDKLIRQEPYEEARAIVGK